jgi:Tol biopolymer transport system component
MGRPLHFSLADLAAAGVPLRPSDAATIAFEVASRAARGDLPGIPSAHVIRLDEEGEIHVEGPVASGRDIERAARLVEALLPPLHAPKDIRVPGALRLVIARALRVLDLPPFESLEAFTDALGRFTVDDSRTVVLNLATAWRSATRGSDPAEVFVEVEVEEDSAPPTYLPAVEPGQLTISDIRRARRATRLTLSEIAERSRIPFELLRQFEWGYLANWPSGFYGRTQIVRYARAAELDERIVVRVALPLLEQWDSAPALEEQSEPTSPAEVVLPHVPAVPTELVHVGPQWLTMPARRRPRARWIAAVAIPALLAVGIIPAFLIMNDRDTPDVVVVRRSEPGPPASAPRVTDHTEQSVLPVPTTLSTTAFSPSFATEGSAVFYHSGAGASSAILKADSDAAGSVLRVTRVVDDRASNFHARPSPDGTLIAFDSDRDGERGIYVADADGRNVRRVSGDGFAAVPSWSPDGRMLAFVRAEVDRPNVWNIWTLDRENGRQTRITSYKVGQPWGAAWFPDGKRIAYSHEDRLVVRALDGSRQRTFASPIRGRLVRTPAVSPDGHRVIFQVRRDGAWLLDVRIERMTRVLDDPSAEEFTWSPDGNRIAYHSRRSGEWGVRVLSTRSLSRSNTTEPPLPRP